MPFLNDPSAIAQTPGTFGGIIAGAQRPDPHEAHTLSDSIIAGLQDSATGLALRGKLPDMHMSPDAPWYDRLAANAAGIAADLPLSVVGAVAGGAALSEVPVLGTVVGAGAGAVAAPMALREALIEAYSNNHAMSWEGAWEIAKAGLAGGAKGAVIGGLTAGAGKAVVPMVAPRLGGAVAGGSIRAGTARVLTDTAQVGTEIAALTATASALNGRMPTWQDFMDNALLLGGMKVAGHVASGMRNVYAETGKEPAIVLSDALKDPELRDALIKAGPGEIPPQYRAEALAERIKNSIDADPRPDMLRQIISGETFPDMTKPPLNDPVRYDYIGDTPTLQGVLRALSDKYSAELETARRGTIPNEVTIAEGARMALAGDVAERVIGTAENASQIAARLHILRGMTQQVFEAAQKLKDVPEENLTPMMKLDLLAKIERLAMAKKEVEGAGAEAGRALQIFRAAKRNPSLFGDVEAALQQYERKGKIGDVAAMVRALSDPAQLMKFSDEYIKATLSEKVIEGWKAGILSGFQTHLANVMGNVGKIFVDIPESAIAAAIEGTRRAARGDAMNMAQFKARALAPWYGLRLGALDGMKVAAEVIKGEGPHLEKSDVYKTAIEGTTGKIVRIPFKLLQAEDAIFRTMGERAKAYEMAIDRASQEGKFHPDTQEFRNQVAAYVEDPTIGLDAPGAKAAIEAIQQAGAESVFSQRLGTRMEMIQRAIQGNVFLNMIVPFIRTPTNLVSWAVQHTPGLNLLSGRWREDFAAGGERRSKAIARVVVGTGMTLAAYELAQNGVITGGGLFDPEQRRTKMAAGWQPYSIKINDRYYSYQRIEPVSKVLGIAADLVEMMDKLDESDRAKAMPLLVLAFGNMTVSTTYLSGISNTMQALTDPTRAGQQFVNQYASSLVPRIIGQVAATSDPYKRQVDSALDSIQAQIPILRERLMPKRDVWGEPQKNEKAFEVLPIQVTEQAQDKVRTEAMRLQVAIADAPKFLTEKGPFKPGDKRIDLTSEQRDIYREVSGKNAMSILAPIVNSPDWKTIPDFAKAAIYKKVLEGTRKQAQYAALPADAAERAAVRQKIVDEIIRQSQQAEGNNK